MIEYELDKEHSILEVRPQSALDKEDFVELAKAVDPHIEANGDLAGLIISAPSFPGWDSFGALVTHFRFVREHQKQSRRSRSSPTPTSRMSPSTWHLISSQRRSATFRPGKPNRRASGSTARNASRASVNPRVTMIE